jgi:tetratricopeptide (TPR) repeat protein
MRSAATADGGAGTAGVSPRPPSWPVRSGTVPAIADGYIDRVETAPDLTAALRPGMMVALVSQRSGDAGQTGSGPASRPASGPGQRTSGPGQRVSGPGQRTSGPGQRVSGPGQRTSGPGQAAGPTARDWLRSTGKTQLAVALAESLWHARELDLLVWIDASSRASVLSGYAAATALVTGRDQATSCESVATQFLSWLAETSHSWLVVLDDLTDEADLDGLYPAGPAGRTLVTCADAAAVPRATRVLPIGPFNSREALAYLTERLSANRGQRLGAIDLVHSMGVEPTALAQASAVIASSTMSCQSYQEYFVRWRDYLANSSGGQPLSSAVTWPVSLDSATAFAPGESVRALLALTALLDGHGIPASVLAAPTAVRYLTGGEAAGEGAEQALAALTALERVGLLTVETASAPPTVRMSPVLQAALRDAIPETLLDQAAQVAADALLQAWPTPEPLGWPASGLRSCTAALQQAAGARLWGDSCHPVLQRAGDSLDHARLTGPAAEHWRELATTADRLFGAGHPQTVLAEQRLAEACLAAGRADDAVSWFHRILDTQTVQLGAEHPDLIGVRLRFCHALVAARQADRAIPLLEQVLADAERVRGPDHLDTLGARDELAAACQAAGRHADAITLYRRTLAARERVQGAQHPETMTTRRSLADSYLARGLSKEAVAAYRRVVSDRERALGPDHLETTRARYSLGAAYLRTGKAVAAERAYEQAQAGFERVLGPRHPDTLRNRAELALVYRQLGRYGDARALLRDTVDRLERILPRHDPLIIELREVLTDIGDE